MALLEEILQLPIEQRMELVEQIWDSISADGGPPMTQAQREELDWRLDHPSEVTYTWEEVEARVLGSRP